MVKTKKMCQGNKRECNPYFCKYTKRCIPKREYTVDSIPLEDHLKKGLTIPKKCSAVDDCLIVGSHAKNINSFFEEMSSFKHVHGPIHKLKTQSSSGFIYVVPYKKGKYTTHAILKSAKKYKSDNLVYEYIVGHTYINHLVDKYPCFIYTYGLYYCNDEKDWASMNRSNELTVPQLKTMLSLQSAVNYHKACSHSKYISILIQGLYNSIRVADVLESSRFLNDNLAHVLFIVYHALSSLSTSFTHYDLHVENVLLVRPSSNKLIRYVYYVQEKPIVFLCPYIPKIIDYGRSFFDNGAINSKTIYDKICSVSECKECGKHSGFSLFNSNMFFTISVQQKNESHDLRLLYTIGLEMIPPLTKSTTFSELQKLMDKVKYGKGIRRSKKIYGTIEQTKLNFDGSSIENVHDAYHQLMYLLMLPSSIEDNKKYDGYAVEGTLHVFNDRPMIYVTE
jgi:hypothetical protein